MVLAYTIISVLIVSAISLLGALLFAVEQKKLEKWLIYLVSLSTGTLLGDAFIHLIPESFVENPNSLAVALFLLTGITTFFILEKFVHWRHCHTVASPDHPHPFSYVILAGDTVHNFIDGLVIAASYMVSLPLGVATTIAVIFHEIPQEIGDFGSLVYGGFSKRKALLFNFGTALFAVFGALLVFVSSSEAGALTIFLIPFAAGGFIYVASADLIPELHKHTAIRKSAGQLFFFLIGIALMAALSVIG